MKSSALAISSRTGLVLLDYLFSEQPRADARRVVIVGADSTGLAAIRELHRLRNGSTTVPVAFLDEDLSKHYRSLGGIPVVGRIADLPAVVREMRADGVVIALDDAHCPDEAARLRREAADLCSSHAIPCQRWVGLIVDE